MSLQKTNLDISPYYDDFDTADNFYKVLFRPGRPVQARELTTLQSILQNQINSFGSHVFKEGSMVIPGQVTYDDKYYAVKLESEHLGLPVSLYVENLKGKKLKGQNSGVELQVNDFRLPDSDDITHLTIFVKYLSADNNNLDVGLSSGEPLIAEEDIVYGNTTISTGDSLANLIESDATAVGSAVHIGAGVYFIRGTFVDVSEDTLILDPYDNIPSYRVGLNILESIITAKDDPQLYDNARGFSNYAAPGADRLKITTTLAKKSLTDFNDTSFVEIIKLREGELKKLQDFSVYNEIAKYFAARTYEESGNYSLGNFNVHISNSLDDQIGNGGIFTKGQTTEQGNTPTDNLGCVEVDPGTAYVKGFRVVRPGTTIVDFDKPRDTETINVAKVPFEMGSLIRVNNVSGTPFVGINNDTNIVTLQDERKNHVANPTSASGSGIGTARVYSFGLRNTPYVNGGSEWDLYLYDIQTYTKLTLNATVDSSQCPYSSYIRGVSSDATGYVCSNPTTVNNMQSEILLSQTSGTFIAGEQILINESNRHVRSISSVNQYGTNDIKSVYQNSSEFTGIAADFAADTVLRETDVPGIDPSSTFYITGDSTGNAGTITSPGNTFGEVKVGAVVKYRLPGETLATLNRVASISADLKTLTVSGLNEVAGVTTGFVGVTSTSAITLVVPQIVSGGISNDAGLYTPLPDSNVSDVNLASSTLLVSQQIANKTPSSGALAINVSDLTGITSSFFSSFDTQKYSISYNDGTMADLTADQFDLAVGGTRVNFTGLENKAATVNVTIEKQVIIEKNKEYNRSAQISIDKTTNFADTSVSGLTTSNFYGLRVQDKEISLNVCDVANVVAVYESKDTSSPTLDKMSFISGLGLDVNSIVGERVTGSESSAVAQIVSRDSATTISVVYLNTNKFIIGEIITFDESNIVTTLQGKTLGNYQDITERYELDKGQREQFYDYSRIVRKRSLPAPSKELLVIYNHYTVPSNDTGDVFTVNSYDKARYTNDIPVLGDGIRATDTLDFRPRVAAFSAVDKSPFAWTSRSFSGSGASPTLVVSPEGDSNLGYSFYLPRIDKLILTPGPENEGEFSLIKGVSSTTPKEPLLIDDAMHLATIDLPAYLYHPEDAKVSLIDNKRYTMRDIGKIDRRVTTLEIVTSLTMLELDTKSLQVRDGTGDRFKSGFFVDDFKDTLRMDRNNLDNRVSINTTNNELIVPLNKATSSPELGLDVALNYSTTDVEGTNPALLDPNIVKTGDLLTLKYDEVSWIENTQASRIENVNPFEVVIFRGTIRLNPSSDQWTRDEDAPDVHVTTLGDEAGVVTNTIKTGSRADTHVRSRNVAFNTFGLKPYTEYTAFFDGRKGIDIIPKLLEITMTSGSFQVGETVHGEEADGTRLISFRVAQSNHRTGGYNAPEKFYTLNPYTKDNPTTISASYTESSTLLNVDTNSLAKDAEGDFYGRVASGLKLVGQTSNAEATIDTVRLIADSLGNVLGSFFIRNPLDIPAPPLRFENGIKTFRLTSSDTNANPLPGDEDTSAGITRGQASYTTAGIVDTYTTTITTIRERPRPEPVYTDPLAQSFTVDESGAFLSSVDLYFAEKPTEDPLTAITVMVVDVELGTPTNQVLADYAIKTLDPADIDVSTDASVATNVKFDSPIYLETGKEYAIVLEAQGTTAYKMWIARMGEPTIETLALGEGSQAIITKQYLGGSLFKSQNGTIWSPSQFEDLKFTLYKCSFITDTVGDLTFYNGRLGSEMVQTMELKQSNPITTFPRKLTVGISGVNSASMFATLTPGKRVSAWSGTTPPSIPASANGYIESIGGSVGLVTLTSGGSGYPASKSGSDLTGVTFFSITGSGSGAIGVVTTNASGQITAISAEGTVASKGYRPGDLLGITTSSLSTFKTGTGARFTVTNNNQIDTLYLTDVQGESFGLSQRLIVYAPDGSTSLGAGATIITSSTLTDELYSGNIFKVQQFNHGMQSDGNRVDINGIEPNSIPVNLTADLTATSTTLTVGSGNTSTFATAEGISTATGYVKVGSEIIYYDGIGSDGTLSLGTRGFGNSSASTHSIGDQVFKYELNGVSLVGINTFHDMPNSDGLSKYRTMDSYVLEAKRTGRTNLPNRGVGKDQVNFNDEGIGGGWGHSLASKNFQYDSFMPSFNILTPGGGTTISAQLRSVSGTSAGGSEASFIDQGYVDVEFNEINPLKSPRLLCSEVDEQLRLGSLPKNKSVTLIASLSSRDSNLSPVVDYMNGTFWFLRNRLNNPVSNYATDGRSNQITGDPHAACYISQVVNLANPSTGLKVLIGAYRSATSDFRVLYRLIKPDSTGVEESYKLFPGYDNLRDVDIELQVIDPALNSGRADVFVRPSRKNEFLDYEFTANNEDEFTGFQIKIVMSGTNEADPPRFQDLRVIALA